MNTVYGSGIVVCKKEHVSPFINLHIAINGRKDRPVQIELHYADEETVIFETDENLSAYYTAVNSGRTLYIATEESYRDIVFTSLTIKVYIRQLKKLNVSGENYLLTSGNTIRSSGSTDIKIQGMGQTCLNLDLS